MFATGKIGVICVTGVGGDRSPHTATVTFAAVVAYSLAAVAGSGGLCISQFASPSHSPCKSSDACGMQPRADCPGDTLHRGWDYRMYTIGQALGHEHLHVLVLPTPHPYTHSS